MRTPHRPLLLLLSGLALPLLFTSSLACKSSGGAGAASAPCRRGPGDDVKMAARTGVEGAKTGVTTGVEGVKTFGNATAGLATGGGSEASLRWREGKEKTKATAHEGAAETRNEASTPPCR